jgi:hypothetical protein
MLEKRKEMIFYCTVFGNNERGSIPSILKDFLEDWLINKLNGYFLLLYSADNYRLAWVVERMSDILVFCLVHSHLIPARHRLG